MRGSNFRAEDRKPLGTGLKTSGQKIEILFREDRKRL